MCSKSIKRYIRATIILSFVINPIDLVAGDYCNDGKEVVLMINDSGQKQYVPPEFCVTVNEEENNYLISNDKKIGFTTNENATEIKKEEPIITNTKDNEKLEDQIKTLTEMKKNNDITKNNEITELSSIDNGSKIKALTINNESVLQGNGDIQENYKTASFIFLVAFITFYYLNRRVKNENYD